MSQHSEVTIEEGSTNVYAGLGYADAAEMQRKSQLAGEIARAIKALRLTQDGAAVLPFSRYFVPTPSTEISVRVR